MSSPERDTYNQPQDDIQVEIIDLELPDHATHNNALLSENCFLNWQRSLTRKHFRHFSTIGLVLLVSFVILSNTQNILPLWPDLRNNITSFLLNPSPGYLRSEPAPVTIVPSIVFSTQQDSLACLVDATWSPDSRDVAFLGYQKSCGIDGQKNGSGLVVIYNVHSGDLVSYMRPDPFIWQTLRMLFSDVDGTPVLSYSQILWSPDGQRLAVPFFVEFPPSQYMDIKLDYNGVLLMNENGTHVQIFVQAQENAFSSVEWDLKLGKVIHNPSVPSILNPSFEDVPLATIYKWDANGSLIPDRPHKRNLSVPDARIGPIGNPVGGTSFTIWQPSMVVFSMQNPDGTPLNGPAVYTWFTTFAAWSPDERYLVNAGYVARLELTGEPSPSHQTLVALHLDRLPTLRVRDMALHRLLKVLASGSSSTNSNMIAWRPSGQVLAAYDAAAMHLGVFDCATGDEIASLSLPKRLDVNPHDDFAVLRWSPDGSRLLLSDSQIGGVVVWNVDQLS